MSFTGPFTIAASIAMGHLLLTDEWPTMGHYDLSADGVLEDVWAGGRRMGAGRSRGRCGPGGRGIRRRCGYARQSMVASEWGSNDLLEWSHRPGPRESDRASADCLADSKNFDYARPVVPRLLLWLN